jgi:hypothetical protein
VRLFAPYGMLFSVALDCLELCLAGWLICLLASGLVVALKVLLCGRWYPLAFCSAFGGKKTIEISRTARERWRSLGYLLFILFILGQLHLWLL